MGSKATKVGQLTRAPGTVREESLEAVRAAERAVYAANAAEPYIHDEYELAEKALRACIAAVTGTRRAREVVREALNSGDAVYVLGTFGYTSGGAR